MDNRITTEEVANQFSKAIQLLLEWAKQEMLVPAQSRTVKPIFDQEHEGDKLLPNMNKLLKPKEVSDLLQISRAMVYQMIQRGEIPAVRMGTAVRVRGIDLEEFIKRSGNA